MPLQKVEGMRKIAVLICTYKRPEGLSRLLQAIEQLRIPASSTLTVIVVDNDPEGGAEAIAKASGRLIPSEYIVEPREGIPAARTAALAASSSQDLVVFIDDDEVPGENWLVELVEAQKKHGADAIAGPVTYVMERPTRPWISECGFYDRAAVKEGDLMPFAATNNLLLSVAALQRTGVTKFEDRYRESGGSDTAFTREFVRHGGRLVWTATAAVTEYVPAARCTPSWAIRRAFRTGNALAVISATQDSARHGRLSITARNLAAAGLRVLSGIVLMLVALVRRDEKAFGRCLRRAVRGCGMAAAAWGRRHREYVREP
jgi:succinoglycan biosynthesis protein ExoM